MPEHFDVRAYLGRIGVTGVPAPGEAGLSEAALARIHVGHATTIPFENLDSSRGLPVSLDSADLERKLVNERRGGYCFEHNLLLAAALERLGATVEPMLARVVLNRPGVERPLTHLLLRVTAGGRLWHADVGFGNGTLLEPIPFGPGGPYEQAGWSFRVVPAGDELVLQTLGFEGEASGAQGSGKWLDVYRFLPRPVARVDIEVSNWFVSTHPTSPFRTGLLLARTDADGTRTALSDFSGRAGLTVARPGAGGGEEREVGAGELAAVVEREFGLPAALLGPSGSG